MSRIVRELAEMAAAEDLKMSRKDLCYFTFNGDEEKCDAFLKKPRSKQVAFLADTYEVLGEEDLRDILSMPKKASASRVAAKSKNKSAVPVRGQ